MTRIRQRVAKRVLPAHADVFCRGPDADVVEPVVVHAQLPRPDKHVLGQVGVPAIRLQLGGSAGELGAAVARHTGGFAAPEQGQTAFFLHRQGVRVGRGSGPANKLVDRGLVRNQR